MDKKRDWLQIIGALVFYAMATTALLISVYLLDALDGYLSGSMRVYVTLGIGIILSVFLAIVTNPVKKKRRIAVLVVLWMMIGGLCGMFLEEDQRYVVTVGLAPTDDGGVSIVPVRLEEPSTLNLTNISKERLSVDGEAELIQMYKAFVEAVYSDSGNVGLYTKVEKTDTEQAFESLLNGYTQVVFMRMPTEEQMALAETKGLELDLMPVAKDGIVFYTHKYNPVDDLSQEQLQDILNGQVTHWNEVGGREKEILTFITPSHYESRNELERQLGVELTDGISKVTEVNWGSWGPIERIVAYRNEVNALGYFYHSFAEGWIENPKRKDHQTKTKRLTVDNVEANIETIRSGEYPLISTIYAVTANPGGKPTLSERNEKVGAFLEWIQGEQGQELVEKAGFVPL